MLISTFELLLKPIAPSGTPADAALRTVLQGYFLSIANPNSKSAKLQLQFTATSPTLNILDTVAIQDVSGTNIFGEVSATLDPRVFTYTFTLPAKDTALFILQPDPQLLATPEQEVEVRGYVEIFLKKGFVLEPVKDLPIEFPPFDKVLEDLITQGKVSEESFEPSLSIGSNIIGTLFNTLSSGEFLLTPEHRGTFLPNDLATPNPDLDQLITALPTATGGALFKLAL